MNKDIIKRCILAILGGAIVGISCGWILIPLKLSTGGFSGLATLMYYTFNWPAGIVTLIMNIPLFIFATKSFGFKYSGRTFLSMVALSVTLTISEQWKPLTDDFILASIFGGALTGLGLALAVRGNATTGGTDLLAKLIQVKHEHLNLGDLLLVIDGLIVVASAYTFDSIDVALYSGIAIYVMSKVMDLIIVGGNYAKAIYIISDKKEEISNYIMNDIGRGLTEVKSIGKFSNTEKDMLFCVANKREIPLIKNKAKEIDPKCFIIITTVTEAIGEGF